jgi:hypothetical protein
LLKKRESSRRRSRQGNVLRKNKGRESWRKRDLPRRKSGERKKE